jgi:hypothetical protein
MKQRDAALERQLQEEMRVAKLQRDRAWEEKKEKEVCAYLEGTCMDKLRTCSI